MGVALCGYPGSAGTQAEVRVLRVQALDFELGGYTPAMSRTAPRLFMASAVKDKLICQGKRGE